MTKHLLVVDAGIQTALGDAQRAPHRHEPGKVFHKAHERRAHAPRNHYGRDPDGRAEALHGQVGRDFRRDVKGEKDRHGNLALSARPLPPPLETRNRKDLH